MKLRKYKLIKLIRKLFKRICREDQAEFIRTLVLVTLDIANDECLLNEYYDAQDSYNAIIGNGRLFDKQDG